MNAELKRLLEDCDAAMLPFAAKEYGIPYQPNFMAPIAGKSGLLMDDGLHPLPGTIGGSIHVRANTNDWHFFVGIGRDGGVHIPMRIEVGVTDTDGQ